MLIEVIVTLRRGSLTRTKTTLRLKCDECCREYDHRQQQEVADAPKHYCCRKCFYVARSKNEIWRKNISESTKVAMATLEVRSNFEAGLMKRSENPNFRTNMSIAAKKRFEDPKECERHSKRIRQKYRDPVYKALFLMRQKATTLRNFRSIRAKSFWSSDENRRAMSLKIIASWKSQKTKHGTPGHIARMSASQKAWNRLHPFARTGSNNPMSGKINSFWRPWMTECHCLIKWSRKIMQLCSNQCMICGCANHLDRDTSHRSHIN